MPVVDEVMEVDPVKMIIMMIENKEAGEMAEVLRGERITIRVRPNISKSHLTNHRFPLLISQNRNWKRRFLKTLLNMLMS